MSDNEDAWENEGGAINTPERGEKEEDCESVLVVSSQPSGEARRLFTVLRPEPPNAPALPLDLATEAELVQAMERLGYRVQMIGRGSRIDEIRRFYFNKLRDESSS